MLVKNMLVQIRGYDTSFESRRACNDKQYLLSASFLLAERLKTFHKGKKF